MVLRLRTRWLLVTYLIVGLGFDCIAVAFRGRLVVYGLLIVLYIVCFCVYLICLCCCLVMLMFVCFV